MRKITFHEEADSEVYEAALYYEERATDLGLAFLDEIEKTSEHILANPMAYQCVGGEVRQALVARFPYSSKSSPTVAAGFPVAESNGAILDRNDAVVGYGHSKDIRSKILEACFARPNGLAVHDPIGLPDLIRDLVQQAGLFHLVSKLRPEDFG